MCKPINMGRRKVGNNQTYATPYEGHSRTDVPALLRCHNGCAAAHRRRFWCAGLPWLEFEPWRFALLHPVRVRIDLSISCSSDAAGAQDVLLEALRTHLAGARRCY